MAVELSLNDQIDLKNSGVYLFPWFQNIFFKRNMETLLLHSLLAVRKEKMVELCEGFYSLYLEVMFVNSIHNLSKKITEASLLAISNQLLGK